MTNDFIINVPVSLLPVLIFLVVLDWIDDHNLIRYYHIIPTILAGVLLGGVAYVLNTAAINGLNLDYLTFTRFGSPVIEEFLKASLMVYFFRTSRIGYSTDAAIRGFAIGAGFAVAENIYYLSQLPDLHIGIWIIRGFGTAIMHGGATAIFGVMTAQLTEENHKHNLALYLPGLFVAIVIHSIYNHFPGTPVLSSFGSTIAIAAVLAWLFKGDTANIRQDLESDLEEHETLLAQLRSDEFILTDDGRFIAELHTEFEAYIVDDIVQYIHLHTELVIAAETRLLAWQQGDVSPVGQDVRNHFDRLHDLKQSIGKQAIDHVLSKTNMSRQELWKLYMLESRAHHETLASDTSVKWTGENGNKE
jgi:RsiW-degrading membrane proteinase PrsW (M82 family)